jgi:hypothetical protein
MDYVLWVVTPCDLIADNNVEEPITSIVRILRNVGNHLQNYKGVIIQKATIGSPV